MLALLLVLAVTAAGCERPRAVLLRVPQQRILLVRVRAGLLGGLVAGPASATSSNQFSSVLDGMSSLVRGPGSFLFSGMASRF